MFKTNQSYESSDQSIHVEKGGLPLSTPALSANMKS